MAGNAAVRVDVDSSIFHLYDSSQSVLPAADAYAELPPPSSMEISDSRIGDVGKGLQTLPLFLAATVTFLPGAV